MRRGISLGGALDGDGPSRLEERHVDAIRDAGFDTLRLPVSWPRTFDEVDEAIDAALRRDLDVIVDVHHFDGPDLGVLWTRIAEHYANWSPRLHFELLNEPHAPMTAEGWNGLLGETLAVVRASNPDRPVIAGPVKWNTVDALPSLRLPDDDHLIATVHYYSPFRFTHQGAFWLEGADEWLGMSWEDDGRIRADLSRAAAWAGDQGHPLLLGEFGTIAQAQMPQRAAWTAAVRAEAERLGLPWIYWDFATEFGAFDLTRDTWHAPLADALGLAIR